MASVIETLRALAEIIRTEKEVGANTAERIGNMFLSIINALDNYPDTEELTNVSKIVAQNVGDIKAIKSGYATKAEVNEVSDNALKLDNGGNAQFVKDMVYFAQTYFESIPFVDVGEQSVQLATKNDIPSIMPLYESGVEIARVDVGGERVFLYAPTAGGNVDLSHYFLRDGSKSVTGDLYLDKSLQMVRPTDGKYMSVMELVDYDGTNTLNVGYYTVRTNHNTKIFGKKIELHNSTSSTTPILVADTNGVLINKDVTVDGTVSQSSDINKKDVISYETSIKVEDVANAPIAYYKWKDKEEDTRHLGTIAQYWRGIAPECVRGKEGNMSLDCSTLALVSAIVDAREIVRLKKLLKEKGYDTDEE